MRWSEGKVPPIRVERANLLRGIYLYTPYNEAYINELKQTVPADLRLWESDEKRWYVFESYAEQAIRLARTYWPHINVSAYNSDSGSQGQQQGQRQQSQGSGQQAPPRWASASRADCATLYLTEDAPPEVIKAAYKALAITHHPDRGGDVAMMRAVNTAFDRLKKAGRA